MDYRTKSTSREKLRELAKIIRQDIFKCEDKYYFDVIKAFEMLPYLSNNSVTTEIVSDDDEELGVSPSTMTFDENGEKYVIKIKESVYEKAYFKKSGGYRMHIMHEICHFLLFIFGFTPYFDRTYRNYELKPYESIEWQAKALAGEILIPYDATKNLTEKQIKRRCRVSKEAAQNRLNMEVKTNELKNQKKKVAD